MRDLHWPRAGAGQLPEHDGDSSAAEATGAGAIHPGYGLLSENAKFAALCEECHIVFIGPTSKVISEMGDKDAARKKP